MSDGLIKIDPKLVDELVKQHIQIAVAEAIGKNGMALIDKLVATIITTRVNAEGKAESHSHYNTQTWLDYAIGDSIRTHVRAVIEEQIVKLRPEIEKSVRSHFAKSANPFAKAVMDGVAHSLKFDWNFKLTLGTGRD